MGTFVQKFKTVYNVVRDGNFGGRNVPQQARLGRRRIRNPTPTRRCSRQRELLLKARAKRNAPRRDDKVLADWNGMAITALANAGSAMRPRPVDERSDQGVRFRRQGARRRRPSPPFLARRQARPQGLRRRLCPYGARRAGAVGSDRRAALSRPRQGLDPHDERAFLGRRLGGYFYDRRRRRAADRPHAPGLRPDADAGEFG